MWLNSCIAASTSMRLSPMTRSTTNQCRWPQTVFDAANARGRLQDVATILSPVCIKVMGLV